MKVIFNFPDDESAGSFFAWFRVGGGEDDFHEFEARDAEEREPIILFVQKTDESDYFLEARTK